MNEQITCPTCYGYEPRDDCPQCNGCGTVDADSTYAASYAALRAAVAASPIHDASALMPGGQHILYVTAPPDLDVNGIWVYSIYRRSDGVRMGWPLPVSTWPSEDIAAICPAGDWRPGGIGQFIDYAAIIAAEG